jgi:2-C-methyl-D-erythritol 4-phosphate cytidylyltransferase
MPLVGEVVIVCDPSWQKTFTSHLPSLPPQLKIKWALPGKERQDSVFNGFQVNTHKYARTHTHAHRCTQNVTHKYRRSAPPRPS